MAKLAEFIGTEWRAAAAGPSSLQAVLVRGESRAPGQLFSEVSWFTKTRFVPPDRADLRVEERSSARPGDATRSHGTPWSRNELPEGLLRWRCPEGILDFSRSSRCAFGPRI